MRTVSPFTFLPLFHFSLFVLPFSGSIRFTLMLPPVRQGNPNVYSWSGTTPPQLSSLSPSLSSPSSTQWQPSLHTVSYWRSTVRTTRGPRSWVCLNLAPSWHSRPAAGVEMNNKLFLLVLMVIMLFSLSAGLCCDGGICLLLAGVLMCVG